MSIGMMSEPDGNTSCAAAGVDSANAAANPPAKPSNFTLHCIGNYSKIFTKLTITARIFNISRDAPRQG
jgi:hypothetical protein